MTCAAALSYTINKNFTPILNTSVDMHSERQLTLKLWSTAGAGFNTRIVEDKAESSRQWLKSRVRQLSCSEL